MELEREQEYLYFCKGASGYHFIRLSNIIEAITSIVTTDGGLMITASWDCTIKVWDIKTRQFIYVFEGAHNRNIWI
jgi:WD domain, G-beta repeat.